MDLLAHILAKPAVQEVAVVTHLVTDLIQEMEMDTEVEITKTTQVQVAVELLTLAQTSTEITHQDTAVEEKETI